jgi:hypothetical protein
MLEEVGVMGDSETKSKTQVGFLSGRLGAKRRHDDKITRLCGQTKCEKVDLLD